MIYRIVLGERSVDLLSGRASDGLQLRPLELRLLQVLARHVGQAVSTRTLFSEALGYHPDSRSQTLYTTIRRLRLAIEPDPSHPTHLLSVRGEGYRLVGEIASREEPFRALPPDTELLVGREGTLQALQRSEAPILTLTGTGGSGKSRLALRHAHHLLPEVRTGWLHAADLPPGGLLPRLGELLHASGERGVEQALRELGRFVLFLDDADHALDEARALAPLFGSGPARLVVTSRSPLMISGEHVLEVGPLEEADATFLLEVRTREQRGGIYAPDEVERQLLGQIAERVDRLPLGLELAASRLGSVSAAAVLEQLSGHKGLRVQRAGPARHRSLAALVDWTWDRLTPDERTFMQRLSVVEGSFHLPVAEAALGDTGPEWDAGSVLTHLHRKGLLWSSPSQRHRPFTQISTVLHRVRAHTPPEVREEALDRLADFTTELACAQVREPFVKLGPFRGGQATHGAEAALRRALRRDPSQLDPSQRGSIWLALCQLQAQQGRWLSLDAHLREALANVSSPPLRAAIRLVVARGFWDCGRWDASCELLREILSETDLPAWSRGDALATLAYREGLRGRHAEVDDLVRQLQLLAPACPPRLGEGLLADVCAVRGHLFVSRADPRAAMAAYEQAERHAREALEPLRAATMVAHRARLLVELDRPAEALALMEGLPEELLLEDLHERVGYVGTIWGLVVMYRSLEEALRLARRLTAEHRALLRPQLERNAWMLQAEVFCWLERPQEATRALDQASGLGRMTPPHAGSMALSRALILLSVGRLLEALSAAQQAMAVAQANNRLMVAEILSDILFAMERPQEAFELLEVEIAARASDSVRSASLLRLAELARALGQRERGRAAALALLAQAPDDERRGMALGYLAEGSPERLREARSLLLHVPDPTEQVRSWLAVFEARVRGAQGPAPRAPAHAPLLRHAVRELWPQPGRALAG
jgi:tetratricopeptide (TPR) repeat protein/DNA-binding winged helix-turn-helix (wHTH) protein